MYAILTMLNYLEKENSTIYEWRRWLLWWGRWDLNAPLNGDVSPLLQISTQSFSLFLRSSEFAQVPQWQRPPQPFFGFLSFGCSQHFYRRITV